MAADNRIQSVLCPNCGRLISAKAAECIHCGMKNPNLWGLSGFLRGLFGQETSFIPAISGVCIGLYVLCLLMDPSAIFRSSGLLGFLSPSSASLNRLGMTGAMAMVRGEWWTLFTAIYLHGGILHILFNVLWIRQLGPVVEDLFGVARAFVIFTLSGVFGFLISNYAYVLSFFIPFTIGASGSIFGLLGALVYYGRRRGGTFGAAVYRQMGQWALVLFIFGFLFPGINNFAHAGGFVGGYGAAALLGFSERSKERVVHYALALLCLVATAVAFPLALLR